MNIEDGHSKSVEKAYGIADWTVLAAKAGLLIAGIILFVFA
jgi:hypothetical protein